MAHPSKHGTRGKGNRYFLLLVVAFIFAMMFLWVSPRGGTTHYLVADHQRPNSNPRSLQPRPDDDGEARLTQEVRIRTSKPTLRPFRSPVTDPVDTPLTQKVEQQPLEPADEGNEAHWIHDALGIGRCGSTTFVQWAGPDGAGINDGEVELVDPKRCPADAIHYRPCVSRQIRFQQGSNAAKTNDGFHLLARDAVKVGPDRYKVAPQLHGGDPNPVTCVSFRCDAACAPEFDEFQCKEDGRVNVLVRYHNRSSALKRRSLHKLLDPKKATGGGAADVTLPPRRVGEAAWHARQPSILLFLLDSVSWSAYRKHFNKTREVLADLTTRGTKISDSLRVAEYHDTNALGSHSANNHPPLLVGKLPIKCHAFRAKREGIPTKKDGAYFHAYNALKQRVLSPQTNRDEIMPTHLLSLAKGSNYALSAALYPVPFTAVEATCLGLDDEQDVVPRYADSYQWRFFNEAVHMYNRALNGSQGCIGDRHSMNYTDQFLEEFFPSTSSGSAPTKSSTQWAPTFGFVAEQTPHQERWDTGAIEYLDERIARAITRLHRSGALDRTVVVLTADHGLGYKKDQRHEMVSILDSVAHPVLLYVLPSQTATATHFTTTVEAMFSNIIRNRVLRTTHFDTYGTLVDLMTEGRSFPPVAAQHSSSSVAPTRKNAEGKGTALQVKNLAGELSFEALLERIPSVGPTKRSGRLESVFPGILSMAQRYNIILQEVRRRKTKKEARWSYKTEAVTAPPKPEVDSEGNPYLTVRQNRSCDEMGVFLHSCRYYEDVVLLDLDRQIKSGRGGATGPTAAVAPGAGGRAQTTPSPQGVGEPEIDVEEEAKKLAPHFTQAVKSWLDAALDSRVVGTHCRSWKNEPNRNFQLFVLKRRTFPDGTAFLLAYMDVFVGRGNRSIRFLVETKPHRRQGQMSDFEPGFGGNEGGNEEVSGDANNNNNNNGPGAAGALGGPGQSPQDRVTLALKHRRFASIKDEVVTVGKVTRISTYAEDERTCGAQVKRSAAMVDMQYCACAKLDEEDPGEGLGKNNPHYKRGAKAHPDDGEHMLLGG